MKIKYYLAEINFTKENYDKVCEILYSQGIRSIHEEVNSFRIFFEESKFSGFNNIKKALLELPFLSEDDIHVEKFENHDWNSEWEKSIEPVFIKDKLIIYPSWKRKELSKYKDRILVEIDPKMSFGTGHSETTQMMLEMICDCLDKTDNYLLDYGCGTAVLAIAAIKSGVRKAVAIDIDEDSIQNSREYIKVNGVSKYIKLYNADISDIIETGFDIVVSNIDKTVITRNIKLIYDKLKPNGKLLVSGILHDEERILMKTFKKNGFDPVETRKSAEWLSFYCRKI